VVKENYRRYACTKCEFSISKHPGSRFFEVDEVEQLLREKQIGPLTGFRSKIGRPFAAALKLTPPEFKLEFDFGAAPGADGAPGEAIDFSGQTPVGKCRKCGGRVFEQPMTYICENSVGGERSCDFRSGKVILQQPVEPVQMKKLLEEGRTDILRNFVSNRTRRKFAAFLVWKADEGKVGFEFEPRPAKGGKKPAPDAAAPVAKRAAAKVATKTAPAAKRSAAAGTTAKTARATAKSTAPARKSPRR
jgi:DNA topoisomerase-3